MFPTPLGRSSLSQSLPLPWCPLSHPRRGCGVSARRSAVPPGDVSSEHIQAVAEGRWMRSKGQREESGAQRRLDALAAGLESWGEKGPKGGGTQPAQRIWLRACG